MASDMAIDEQSSANITVFPKHSDGSPIILTNCSITWKASFNGEEKIKKDTAIMTIMIGPQLSTTSAASAAAGQKLVKFTNIDGFGADGYGRVINDLTAGDIVTIINNASQEEYCTVASIDATTKYVTMESNLIYIHQSGNVIKRIVSDFRFGLLPGDTILPPTKVYGTPFVWQHMALATFPAGLSPGNIYQEATTMVLMRGRLFINPIIDMS